MTSTKMLINATRSQMLRVAIIEGTILQEYQVEIEEGGLTRGNIYRGVVANIQPSLNAAFIDIGEERHAFLPVADVLPSAYHRQPPSADSKRPRIDQVLEKGKPILVQVTKDGVGQKGAALTTNIALAGRYLVLTPFDEVRGISRKAEDDDERKTVRDRLKRLALPDGYGVIVRTNGLEQNQTTLTKDLNALLRLWRTVHNEGASGHGARLVYSDQDLVVQMMRDYLDIDIAQVVVDNDEVYAKVDEYMKAFMPRSKTKLIRYAERLPLFSRFRIETQIDRIYERTAPLPGGGSIVIDSTEALTAIDVNSGRATRTADHDESIFNINVEAANEVARQLRLRDIGGLVVVDFIDMRFRKHQNKLEKVMRDAMRFDKARYSVGRISPNGLLEINRQRIKQALRLRTHRPCPTCQGSASIPTPDFAAQRILTRIEARASTGLMKSATFGLHPEIADALQNGHRRELAAIENDYGITLEIITAPGLARTEERVEWIEREPGSEPVVPATAVIRASDLTRADLEEKAAAKDKAMARALPVKQGIRKASEAVPMAAGGEEGEGEKTRRRRRRRRRRGGGSEEGQVGGEETLLQQQLDGGDYEDDDEGEEETLEAAEKAEVQQAEEPRPARSRRSRSRNKRLQGERSAVATQPAALEVQGQEDFEEEAEDGVETSGESQGAAGEAGDEEATPGRRRRRRRRGGRGRRKKGQALAGGEQGEEGSEAEGAYEADSEQEAEFFDDAEGEVEEAPSVEPEVAAASASEDEALVEEEPAPPAKAKRQSSRRRSTKAKAETKAEAEAPAEVEVEKEEPAPAAESQDDDSPAPRRKRRTPSRARKPAATAAPPEAEPNFEEQQPASNESALHQASPGLSPVPAAPIGVLTGQGVDRTASMRLRWQWWGGLKGEGAPPPEDGEEGEE